MSTPTYKRTPIYKNPASYARKNGELDLYRESNKANIACKEAIEQAIADHYYGNILHDGAVKVVVDKFGYDRTLYVLANTVRQKDWDGRISRDNKAWAQTIPIYENPDTLGNDSNSTFVVDKAHTCLTDLFISQIRREYLLTKPLTKQEINEEAARLLRCLQSEQEPNNPEKTHYSAKLSPSFTARAKAKDLDKLSAMLPFESLSLTMLSEKEGMYATISKEENRDRKLYSKKPRNRNERWHRLSCTARHCCDCHIYQHILTKYSLGEG